MKIDWKKTAIISGVVAGASGLGWLLWRYEKAQEAIQAQAIANAQENEAENEALQEEQNQGLIASLPSISSGTTVASTGTVDSGNDVYSSPTGNSVDPSIADIVDQFAALAAPISTSLPAAATVTVLPFDTDAAQVQPAPQQPTGGTYPPNAGTVYAGGSSGGPGVQTSSTGDPNLPSNPVPIIGTLPMPQPVGPATDTPPTTTGNLQIFEAPESNSAEAT